MTTVFSAFYEAHSALGWFLMGIGTVLGLWILLRLGLLAGIIFNSTFDILRVTPLTTNFSAWYAGNALAVLAFFFALAAFGFYTSQAGRPIFADALRVRVPS